MIFDYDIAWCWDSTQENGCDYTACTYHIINKPKIPEDETDIFTMAARKNTEDCPYFGYPQSPVKHTKKIQKQEW